MPCNDKEVFEHFTTASDTKLQSTTESQIDFISYAIFAYHKKKWMELCASRNNGNIPSQKEIDNWISNITEVQYSDMRDDAARFFDIAARNYLAEEIQQAKKDAVDTSILSEVKRYSSPWRHLGIALLMAVVAPFMQEALCTSLGFIMDQCQIPWLDIRQSGKNTDIPSPRDVRRYRDG